MLCIAILCPNFGMCHFSANCFWLNNLSSVVVFEWLLKKSIESVAPCASSLLFSALQVKKHYCKILFCDLQPRKRMSCDAKTLCKQLHALKSMLFQRLCLHKGQCFFFFFSSRTHRHKTKSLFLFCRHREFASCVP